MHNVNNCVRMGAEPTLASSNYIYLTFPRGECFKYAQFQKEFRGYFFVNPCTQLSLGLSMLSSYAFDNRISIALPKPSLKTFSSVLTHLLTCLKERARIDLGTALWLSLSPSLD